jgi:hypothetical protein
VPGPYRLPCRGRASSVPGGRGRTERGSSAARMGTAAARR